MSILPTTYLLQEGAAKSQFDFGLVQMLERQLWCNSLHCRMWCAASARVFCESNSRNCKRRVRPQLTSSETVPRKCGLGIPNFDLLNGHSGEIRGVAKSVPPQLQTNAASATWPNVNVGKVRHSGRPSRLPRKSAKSIR